MLVHCAILGAVCDVLTSMKVGGNVGHSAKYVLMQPLGSLGPGIIPTIIQLSIMNYNVRG